MNRRDWLAGMAAAGLPAMGRAQDDAGARRPLVWPPLVSITGETLQTGNGAGVPMVVVFWATWCAYCRRHNAHVDTLYRTVDPQRLRVVTVVIDGDAASARRYMDQAGYRFPVVLDAGRLRQRFTDRRVVPMTCTVDAQGRVGLCMAGEMSEDDLLGLARP